MLYLWLLYLTIMAKKEYAQANKDWLLAKSQEEGVIALPKGVYYKVISQGKNDGKHPTPRSIVTAHYTGWTINGKKFDSSRGGVPVAFRLNELITGWSTALREMPAGSRWEIVIPYNLGYGSRPAGAIKAFSTLIFDITLLDVR